MENKNQEHTIEATIADAVLSDFNFNENDDATIDYDNLRESIIYNAEEQLEDLTALEALVEAHNNKVIGIAGDLAEEELAKELGFDVEYLYDDKGNLKEAYMKRFNTIYDGYYNTLSINN